MIAETDMLVFKNMFPSDPHSFVSEEFIELNKGKTERVIRLVDVDKDRPVIGLVAGIKDGIISSPFSAPFGGFHFRNQNIYISEIDNFIYSLKEYAINQSLKGIEIVLPPDIYHQSFNAKVINSFIRIGFESAIPEITNWVDLRKFKDGFTQKNSREYFRQAVRHGLSFESATDNDDKAEIFDLICKNRAKFERPIYMTLKDILETGKLWQVEFFKVTGLDGVLLASAIFYRNHPEIGFAVFWGDNDLGRPLRAMDFLVFNLWMYYKQLDYTYLDMGISSESGFPNEGLLRFKETHDSSSSLRFKFFWKA